MPTVLAYATRFVRRRGARFAAQPASLFSAVNVHGASRPIDWQFAFALASVACAVRVDLRGEGGHADAGEC